MPKGGSELVSDFAVADVGGASSPSRVERFMIGGTMVQRTRTSRSRSLPKSTVCWNCIIRKKE